MSARKLARGLLLGALAVPFRRSTEAGLCDLLGWYEQAGFGWSVARAADLDGDGRDDLAVGAHDREAKGGALHGRGRGESVEGRAPAARAPR